MARRLVLALALSIEMGFLGLTYAAALTKQPRWLAPLAMIGPPALPARPPDRLPATRPPSPAGARGAGFGRSRAGPDCFLNAFLHFLLGIHSNSVLQQFGFSRLFHLLLSLASCLLLKFPKSQSVILSENFFDC